MYYCGSFVKSLVSRPVYRISRSIHDLRYQIWGQSLVGTVDRLTCISFTVLFLYKLKILFTNITTSFQVIQTQEYQRPSVSLLLMSKSVQYDLNHKHQSFP